MAERLIRLAHTGAHAAHGVILAGDQQDGRLPIHLPQVAGPLVEADAPQHLVEQAHGGVMAAQGVGDVVVHILLIRRQPVVFGAVGLEGLVVRAEGQGRHRGVGGRRVPPGQRSRQGKTARQRGRALPPGAHQDGGFHRAGIADEIGAAEEGAHGVAHQQQRQMGVLLLQPGVQHIHVVHRRVPGAAVAEIHRRAALGQGLAVAQVVVAHHDDAVTVEEPGKIVITVDVLRHAVDQLQHRHRRHILRHPRDAVQPRFPVAGKKREVSLICHGNSVLPVIYSCYYHIHFNTASFT